MLKFVVLKNPSACFRHGGGIGAHAPLDHLADWGVFVLRPVLASMLVPAWLHLRHPKFVQIDQTNCQKPVKFVNTIKHVFSASPAIIYHYAKFA